MPSTSELPSSPDESAVKRSPGRPPVPLDSIVEAALLIVDDRGADALSMRTLAQRLGTGTTTLYRHFTSRAEVIAYVVDRVLGEVALATDELDTTDWQHACKVVAQMQFEVLRRHPNVAPLLLTGIPVTPNALVLRERAIAAFLAHNFSPEMALRSYTSIARFVLGFAIQLAGDTAADGTDQVNVAALFRGFDPQRFPATIAVAGYAPIPLEEEFAFGLDLIISGLAQQLSNREP